MKGGRMDTVRLAFGGVAAKPWRAPAAETLLTGQPPSPALFARAADAVLADARGQGGNDFKIPLLGRTLGAWADLRNAGGRVMSDPIELSLSHRMNSPDEDNLLDRTTQGVIGTAMDRPEGALKVSRTATYADEDHPPGTVYGWLVRATVNRAG